MLSNYYLMGYLKLYNLRKIEGEISDLFKVASLES